MKTGKIVQVMGPVVDVEFEDNDLPFIKDALEVDNGGKRCVMEVAQHIGNNTVRCIMLAASEGLHKDMEVVATGSGITVPVGQGTLGRLFNVLGDTLDGGKTLEGEKHWCIHRDPPSFEDQSPVVEVLETGLCTKAGRYSSGRNRNDSFRRRGAEQYCTQLSARYDLRLSGGILCQRAQFSYDGYGCSNIQRQGYAEGFIY